MELVYDENTQSEINTIISRMTDIESHEKSQLDRSVLSLYEIERLKNNYCNPLDNNIEYQNLQKRLEQIYLFAVPKLILTSDEYKYFTTIFKPI